MLLKNSSDSMVDKFSHLFLSDSAERWILTTLWKTESLLITFFSTVKKIERKSQNPGKNIGKSLSRVCFSLAEMLKSTLNHSHSYRPTMEKSLVSTLHG
jgi:hypothetical protein